VFGEVETSLEMDRNGGELSIGLSKIQDNIFVD
jgi:hypothetical protein